MTDWSWMTLTAQVRLLGRLTERDLRKRGSHGQIVRVRKMKMRKTVDHGKGEEVIPVIPPGPLQLVPQGTKEETRTPPTIHPHPPNPHDPHLPRQHNQPLPANSAGVCSASVESTKPSSTSTTPLVPPIPNPSPPSSTPWPRTLDAKTTTFSGRPSLG